MPPALQSALGLIALPLIAWAVSENRKHVNLRTVLSALLLQILLAVVLLKFPGTQVAFELLNRAANALEASTRAGTSFVFGYVGGAAEPFAPGDNPAASTYVLAFRGMFLLVVVGALSSLLFYWRILPLVVRGFAFVLKRLLGIGGAEGLIAAANVFLGMIEAPLFIRPYVSKLNRGELFSLMTCGMATIAGTVMVLYASFLHNAIPNAMGNLLVASIISAPAAIAMAHIMVPAPKGEYTEAEVMDSMPASSSMEAITNGTVLAVKMLIDVLAMLVVLVALVHLVNLILGIFPGVAGEPLTLQRILGWIMWPVVWLIGIPASECAQAGSLMGIKTILNELLAYLDMAHLPAEALGPRSKMILTYALCGFANLGSLGIMIGGLGRIAPERRGEIAALGMRSIVAGTFATLMTGAVVGVIY